MTWKDNFKKMFHQDVRSDGTWKLQDGVVLAKIDTSTDKERRGQIHSFRVRSINSTELVAVDANGNEPLSVRELGTSLEDARQLLRDRLLLAWNRSAAERAGASSQEIRQVEITNGTITITYGKQSDRRIVRKKLALRPYVLEFGGVGWQCGNAEPPEGGTPSSLGGITSGTISSPGKTTLPDKFLPAMCRSGYVTGSEEPTEREPESV